MLIAFLLIVTFASLALSAGLLTYVLRLTREERDRSEARAAALEQALGTPPEPLERWSPEQTFASDVAKSPLAPVALDAPYAPDAPFAPYAPVTSPSFFGTHAGGDETALVDEKSSVPRAILVPAVGVLVVALIGGLGIGVVWTRNHLSGSTKAAAQESTGAPLELVSLKHERVGDGLHISGVVRNPQDGRVVKGLAAVAFLFDRDGNYLSSDRAPLDYVQLLPGEESPFSIAVPSAAGVSRYRVTFRTDAGIVAHVDRRNDPPVVPAASR
jgi:hypothetical protein